MKKLQSTKLYMTILFIALFTVMRYTDAITGDVYSTLASLLMLYFFGANVGVKAVDKIGKK